MEDGTGALLEETIKEARRVLTELNEYLRGNETATRALVIDGVLTALGWDIKDPARVRLEHRSHGNKVDYVLVSSAGAFLAVVEAKACGFGAEGNGSEAGVWIRNGNRRPLRSANKWRPMGSVGDGAAETQKGEHLR